MRQAGSRGQVAGVARDLSPLVLEGWTQAGSCCSHFGLLHQSTHKLGSLNGLILSTGGQKVQDPGADRVKQGTVVSSSCDKDTDLI